MQNKNDSKNSIALTPIPNTKSSPLNYKQRPYRKKSHFSSNTNEGSFSQTDGVGRSKNGRWSLMEHVRFLEALKMYGKNWKKVEEYVATRTSTQARSHAQKFFSNGVLRSQTMQEFLEKISQESLTQLKLIAQQCQEQKVSINAETMCDQPEVLELVMMHMSKGYHEEELELVKQQFMLVGGNER